MSTTPAHTPPAAAPAPAPTSAAARMDQVVAELNALARQPSPVDPREAQLAGARWIEERWITDELEPYRGETIVVLDGAVVAHGADPNELQLDVVRRLGVHPYQLVTVYVPQWGEAFNR